MRTVPDPEVDTTAVLRDLGAEAEPPPAPPRRPPLAARLARRAARAARYYTRDREPATGQPRPSAAAARAALELRARLAAGLERLEDRP